MALVMSPNRDGEQESKKRQRMRSLAIALVLGVMAVLFYLATIVHLGSNVGTRPL